MKSNTKINYRRPTGMATRGGTLAPPGPKRGRHARRNAWDNGGHNISMGARHAAHSRGNR